MQQARDSFLTVLLMSVPVLVAYFTAVSKISRKLFIALLVALALLLALRAHGNHALVLAPWLPNMITEYGVLGYGVLENLGVKPIVLSPFVRVLITLVVLSAAAACFAALLSFRTLRPQPSGKLIPSWSVTLTIIGPFAVAYILLLLPRAAL